MKTKNVIMGLIALSTIASIGLVVATDNTTEPPVTYQNNTLTEPSITILPTTKTAPEKIIKTNTKIEVTGAKCSCGEEKDYNKLNNNTYKNECPFCNGKLIAHNGSYKRTNVPEWELTCQDCGFDSCMAHGNDKSIKNRKTLEKMEEI